MLKTKLIAAAITLASGTAFAQTAVFPGAAHCFEDSALKAEAVNNLIASSGELSALTQVALEEVGASANGYFIFDPKFSRTERFFHCSVPLNENMGNVTLTVHGITQGLNVSAGGCLISRIRKTPDGGKDKWLRFGTGKGFDWTDISDDTISSKQFVNYVTTIDNNFEPDAILNLQCRTTWQTGSVSVGQIEINY
ncbi:hypothetical protein [Pseudoalteromonas ruthenica]|uniref:hypothetical protein n=1 Tax=Pseudoalteromonas ruthenica TaxID=151081 RepID=UPI00241C7BE0|nr:hypothetical protein [Pseudoalteromonas ruthenica]|tara:strand:- start:46296 stop:46880 length:585 start_codon:yes stop_codon:yes gene_type:complete